MKYMSLFTCLGKKNDTAHESKDIVEAFEKKSGEGGGGLLLQLMELYSLVLHNGVIFLKLIMSINYSLNTI